ncbi:MAG TPA: inactive serine/threonine-protein kinase VRK3, partial [Ktedonobacteraceae bacterium]
MSHPHFCDMCGERNQAQARFCRACGHPLNAGAGQLRANTLLKQHYLILKVVGQGGFGVVYLAEDTMFGNRRVALKEMSQSSLTPQDRQERVSTFKQEAFMLAGLQHPNLPGIFEYFEENQRWYLVMSFIEGV